MAGGLVGRPGRARAAGHQAASGSAVANLATACRWAALPLHRTCPGCDPQAAPNRWQGRVATQPRSRMTAAASPSPAALRNPARAAGGDYGKRRRMRQSHTAAQQYSTSALGEVHPAHLRLPAGRGGTEVRAHDDRTPWPLEAQPDAGTQGFAQRQQHPKVTQAESNVCHLICGSDQRPGHAGSGDGTLAGTPRQRVKHGAASKAGRAHRRPGQNWLRESECFLRAAGARHVCRGTLSD